MNNQSQSFITRLFLFSVSLEAVIVQIAVLVVSLMERNALMMARPDLRVGLKAGNFLFLIYALLIWIVFFRIDRLSGRVGKAINLWIGNSNTRLLLLDLLVFMVVSSAVLISFLYYSPNFLSFLWRLLPAIVIKSLPVLFFLWMVSVHLLILFIVLTLKDGGEEKRAEVWKKIKIFLVALALFAGSFMVYHLVSQQVYRTFHKVYNVFPDLAHSFLQGNLFVENPKREKDLTPYLDKKYYVSFPPLASLLMLPQVAKSTKYSIDVVIFSESYASLSIALLFLCLEALRWRGWIRLQTRDNLLLAGLLGFGTPLFYMTVIGIMMQHTSQVLAVPFLALASWFVISNTSLHIWPFYRSAFLAGIALGMAMLARTHIGIAGLFICLIAYQHARERHFFQVRRMSLWFIAFATPLVVVILGIFWYNQVRFGAPLDFGYQNMLVAPRLVEPLAKYGQFHPHFILANLKANWLGLPYWDSQCGRLVPNGEGMSIFLVTPVLIYLWRAFQNKPWMIGAWVSLGLIALVHLLYYNTGFYQFGYRFSLDFMIPAICLLAVAMRQKLSPLAFVLIVYSIVVNFIGVLWYGQLWCG